MAERLLTPEKQQRLASEFDDVDIQKMGKGECDRLLRMADSLLGGVTGLSKA